MADPTARAELYSRLSEVIGVDNAGTLMSYLPAEEPSTKADVLAVRNELASVKTELRDEIASVKSELRDEIASVKTELRDEIALVKTELRDEIASVKTELSARMDRFEDKLDGFHHALLTQSRTYLISMVGSVLTTAGLVIAITRLG